MRGEFLQIVDDSGCVAEEAVLMGGLLAFPAFRTDSAVSTLAKSQRVGHLEVRSALSALAPE